MTATVVCYILTQILCVVSQKTLQLRPPTGAPPLDAGPPVFFCVPPIILRDRRPWLYAIARYMYMFSLYVRLSCHNFTSRCSTETPITPSRKQDRVNAR